MSVNEPAENIYAKLKEPIDYMQVDAVLDSERGKSWSYLKGLAIRNFQIEKNNIV